MRRNAVPLTSQHPSEGFEQQETGLHLAHHANLYLLEQLQLRAEDLVWGLQDVGALALSGRSLEDRVRKGFGILDAAPGACAYLLLWMSSQNRLVTEIPSVAGGCPGDSNPLLAPHPSP